VRIEPEETILVGRWVSGPQGVTADVTCKRILRLVQLYLILLGRDASGWNSLHRDPQDGRLWELSYPESQLHGGGPPQLRQISLVDAMITYGRVAG
jgi:hypothetical protein